MVLGRWLYSQDGKEHEYTIAPFEKGFYFSQQLADGKVLFGEITQRVPGLEDDDPHPWQFESSLTNGARVHFQYRTEENVIVTTYRRKGGAEWRPPITASKATEPQPQPQPQDTGEASLAVRGRRQERFPAGATLRASQESLLSHIRRVVLGTVVRDEIRGGTSDTLREATLKQVSVANQPSTSVFSCVAPMPLAERLEGEALEGFVDDRSKGLKLRHTIAPIPSVRLMPKLQHPLSYNEEQMLRLYLADPWNTGYHITIPLGQSVPLDAGASQAIGLHLARRHDVLRSAFRMDESNNPFRLVEREHQGGTYTLCQSTQDQVGDIVRLSQVLPNALGVSGMRVFSMLSHEGLGTIGVNLHHSIADGESGPLVAYEYTVMQQCYFFGFSVEAVEARLPQLPVQYVDFAYWQRTLSARGLQDQDLTYWMSQAVVTYPLPVLDIPIDLPRQRFWVAVGQTERQLVDGSVYGVIQTASSRATPFSVLLACYGIALARITGDADVLVATPFGLRALPSVTNLIGDFVNMLAMNIRYDPLENFASMLDKAAARSINLHRYPLAPLLLLVGALRPYTKPDPSRNAIYQTMIDCLEQESGEPSNAMAGVQDFFIFASTRHGKIYCLDATFNTTILEHQTVRLTLLHLQALTTQVARATNEPVPRLLPCVEEVQGAESCGSVTLARAKLQVGAMPHAIAIKSGWDVEGCFQPREYFDIRASRRLKQVSCLHLRSATGFPELVAKNERKKPAADGKSKSKPVSHSPAAAAVTAELAPAPQETKVVSSEAAALREDGAGAPQTDGPEPPQTDLVVAAPPLDGPAPPIAASAGEDGGGPSSVAKAEAKGDDRKADIERRMAQVTKMRAVAKAEANTKRVNGTISLDGPLVHRSRRGRAK